MDARTVFEALALNAAKVVSIVQLLHLLIHSLKVGIGRACKKIIEGVLGLISTFIRIELILGQIQSLFSSIYIFVMHLILSPRIAILMLIPITLFVTRYVGQQVRITAVEVRRRSREVQDLILNLLPH